LNCYADAVLSLNNNSIRIAEQQFRRAFSGPYRHAGPITFNVSTLSNAERIGNVRLDVSMNISVLPRAKDYRVIKCLSDGAPVFLTPPLVFTGLALWSGCKVAAERAYQIAKNNLQWTVSRDYVRVRNDGNKTEFVYNGSKVLWHISSYHGQALPDETGQYYTWSVIPSQAAMQLQLENGYETGRVQRLHLDDWDYSANHSLDDLDQFNTSTSGIPKPDAVRIQSFQDYPSVFLVPPCGITFVTDVDDVLRVAKIWRSRQMIEYGVFRNYEPWKNMPDIFKYWERRWKEENPHFHYTTLAPMQLSLRYLEFLYQFYPEGTFDSRGSLDGLAGALEARNSSFWSIVKAYPQRDFVLVGDVSNPEIISVLASLLPEPKVRCILIRNTPTTEPDFKSKVSYAEMAAKGPQFRNKYFFFNEPDDIRGLDFLQGECRNTSVQEDIPLWMQTEYLLGNGHPTHYISPHNLSTSFPNATFNVHRRGAILTEMGSKAMPSTSNWGVQHWEGDWSARRKKKCWLVWGSTHPECTGIDQKGDTFSRQRTGKRYFSDFRILVLAMLLYFLHIASCLCCISCMLPSVYLFAQRWKPFPDKRSDSRSGYPRQYNSREGSFSQSQIREGIQALDWENHEQQCSREDLDRDSHELSQVPSETSPHQQQLSQHQLAGVEGQAFNKVNEDEHRLREADERRKIG
jgi:hypothetical protein